MTEDNLKGLCDVICFNPSDEASTFEIEPTPVPVLPPNPALWIEPVIPESYPMITVEGKLHYPITDCESCLDKVLKEKD